jgi:hypothetical protein
MVRRVALRCAMARKTTTEHKRRARPGTGDGARACTRETLLRRDLCCKWPIYARQEAVVNGGRRGKYAQLDLTSG